MYVPALVFMHFAQWPTKHANFHEVQYFLQFGYTIKTPKMHDTVTSIIKSSAEEYNFKEPLVVSHHLTQLVQGLYFVTGPKFCHFTLISLWMFVMVCSPCMLCAGFVETVNESEKISIKLAKARQPLIFFVSQQENDLWERQ